MRLTIALFLAIGLIGLIGCAGQHSDSPGVTANSSAVVSAASLQAFQTTLYAFGQTQGCVNCHSQNVSPQWMNADLNTAYSFAFPLLNLDDPTNSIFATYVANNHCGVAICANAANIPTMQDLLSQWATAELNQDNGMAPTTPGLTLPNPPYVTQTMAIPAGLPVITGGTPDVVRFDLSQLTPPVASLSGAILELSIDYYNTSDTTYKVFNPRLVGNTASVTLTDIHVYVRPSTGSGLGTEDLNQGLAWSQITIIAPMVAEPSPLPTGPMNMITPLVNTSLGIAVQSSADVITVGFAGIK